MSEALILYKNPKTHSLSSVMYLVLLIPHTNSLSIFPWGIKASLLNINRNRVSLSEVLQKAIIDYSLRFELKL